MTCTPGMSIGTRIMDYMYRGGGREAEKEKEEEEEEEEEEDLEETCA